MKNICKIDGCGQICEGWGLCAKHYQRLYRLGKTELKSTEDRFWEKVKKTAACWEWISNITTYGYGQFIKNDLVNSRMAHRYSWALHFGEIPKGKYICHKCDNRKCVNPAHLFLGDHHANMSDMVSKGRAARGLRAKDVKLKESEVIEIYKSKERHSVLARKYKVSNASITLIKAGKNWNWLTKNIKEQNGK